MVRHQVADCELLCHLTVDEGTEWPVRLSNASNRDEMVAPYLVVTYKWLTAFCRIPLCGETVRVLVTKLQVRPQIRTVNS